MKHSFRTIIVAFTLFALLIAPNLGNSQKFNFPASKDPAVFKAQLLQFVQLTRKNLLEIQALPVDDSSPIDPSLINSAHSAYALIRSALHGRSLPWDNKPTRILRSFWRRNELSRPGILPDFLPKARVCRLELNGSANLSRLSHRRCVWYSKPRQHFPRW